jgi:hypothetical protein
MPHPPEPRESAATREEYRQAFILQQLGEQLTNARRCIVAAQAFNGVAHGLNVGLHLNIALEQLDGATERLEQVLRARQLAEAHKQQLVVATQGLPPDGQA